MLENKLQNEYMKKSRQVTLGDATDALDDTAVGTGELTAATLADTEAIKQAHLDQLAIKLIESGATEGDSSGWVELGSNGPVFPLIIGMEASNALIKDGGTGELRTDYREGAPQELLRAIGADRVVGNFRHIVVVNPPRFKRNSGDTGYDRVSEYVAKTGGEAPAGGSGVKLNPLYTAKTGTGAATVEGCIVLNPSVMRQLVVPSATPGNLGFSPENYSGDWKFITGGYKWGGTNADCDDPLEVNGRHVGTYEMAFEPVFGEHGATVLFDR